MPASRDHHRTKRRIFEILVVPQEDAGEKRSMVLTLPMIVGILCGTVVLIAAAVVLVLGYTPIGALMPISNSEVQRRYGDQLLNLQSRLTQLSQEVVVMREYNHKLRTALGESVPRDTIALPAPRSAESLQRFPLQAESRMPGTWSTVGAQVPLRPQVTSAFRASFPISLPVAGFMSQGFDPAKRHFGVDYAGKTGSVVSAAADGYVIFSGWTYDDGNMVILSHGAGYFTIYKHNQSLLKMTGEFVRRGQPISLLGNSGTTSRGPHLHFELWKDGLPENPEEYLLSAEGL